ncbi:MAG: IS21 family transposase [Leptolyngbyaceae cyanobacterium]
MGRSGQGAKLPMVKFREIIRLHELGYNQSEIALSCTVARSTVQDYIRRASGKGLSYEELSQLSDSEAQARLGKGKQPKVETAIDFAGVHRDLQGKGVTLALLWQEGLDQQQWNLSYGQFCRRYGQWKGQQNLSMRQTHQGGEKMFVDYCGQTVAVYDPVSGETQTAQIFVACLGASNYTFAEATPTQSLPHWIGSHERALAFFGGVPKAIVPDNLKSGVTDPCRYEPGVNQSYHAFAEHYQVAILPARSKKPRDKSKVEKAVQEVERQILAPLRHQRFTSFTDLNAAIRERLEKLNHRLMKSYGCSRRVLFEQVDQPALQPLPTHPFVFARWKQAKVNLDYHLEVDKHYYSVPYWFVRRQVNVKVSESLVEIFFEHRRIAVHPRSGAPYRHTTLPEHMPPEHWAYQQQSQETFLVWAQQVGPQTHRQVTAIFAAKDHEEQAFRTLKGLPSLATRYGTQRLEDACRRANTFELVGYRRLKAILKAQLDRPVPLLEVPQAPSARHDYVRGADYYH